VEFLRGNLHAVYHGPFNANVLKVHGVVCASAGDIEDNQAGTQSIIYQDESSGIYQRAIVKDDRLIGIVMYGDSAGFADYVMWIAKRTELDERRATLLRGGAAIAPIEGTLICSCNQIGDETITRTIVEQSTAGNCSVASVCQSTRAGTACGSCRPEVSKLLATHQATHPNPAMAG
jgi:ferredoxin-nitrate reductase